MVINILLRSLAIGAVAGLRSMTAPAVTLGAADSVWAGTARIAAAGELVVDKLPVAPSRLLPGPLAVRVLAGALCGRALARRAQASQMLGTLAGGLGAIAGSFGGYHARRYLASQRRVPDFPLALVEDALAIGLARVATGR